VAEAPASPPPEPQGLPPTAPAAGASGDAGVPAPQ
jgi:hypothetical protein